MKKRAAKKASRKTTGPRRSPARKNKVSKKAGRSRARPELVWVRGLDALGSLARHRLLEVVPANLLRKALLSHGAQPAAQQLRPSYFTHAGYDYYALRETPSQPIQLDLLDWAD